MGMGRGEIEMTEQKQMQKVVEKMPEMFRAERGGDEYEYKIEDGIECARDTAGSLYLSPAQHAAWVCEKLMAWLEGKGYLFRRLRIGTWQAWSHIGAYLTEGTQWQALHAAFCHWEESQQKPKKVDCKYFINTRCEHPERRTITTICHKDERHPCGYEAPIMQEQQKPKEKTLRENARAIVEGMRGEMPDGDWWTTKYKERSVDEIVSLVTQHIKSRKGVVEEIVAEKSGWLECYVKKLVDAIMAAFEEKSDE